MMQDAASRERVSTRGAIRALEPGPELSAFRVPPELIGEISELATRRYMGRTQKFGKKFGKMVKAIERARGRNLGRARQGTVRNMVQLQALLHSDQAPDASEKGKGGEKGGAWGVKGGLVVSGSWQRAWALDMGENLPPSIVPRRRAGSWMTMP